MVAHPCSDHALSCISWLLSKLRVNALVLCSCLCALPIVLAPEVPFVLESLGRKKMSKKLTKELSCKIEQVNWAAIL